MESRIIFAQAYCGFVKICTKFSPAAVPAFSAIPPPRKTEIPPAAADNSLLQKQRQTQGQFQLIDLSGEAASAPAFMRGLAKIFDF